MVNSKKSKFRQNRNPKGLSANFQALSGRTKLPVAQATGKMNSPCLKTPVQRNIILQRGDKNGYCLEYVLTKTI
jgi:hypothetical protein